MQTEDLTALSTSELLARMTKCNVRWVYGPSTRKTDAEFVALCAEYDRRNKHVAGAVSPDPGTNARYLWEESEANARLIAAAPELYVALHDLANYDEEHDGPSAVPCGGRCTLCDARALLSRLEA